MEDTVGLKIEQNGDNFGTDLVDRHRSRSRSRSRSRERRGDRRRDREDREDRRPPRTDNMKSKRVYICNLPYTVKWQDVKDLMKQEVGDAYVELYEENGKASGCGVVEFKTLDQAKQCVEKMFRYDYKGRKIIVREEREKDRERHSRMQSSGGRFGGTGPMDGLGLGGRGYDSGMDSMGGGRGGQQFNLYGINPDDLRRLGIEPPLVNQVFVTNLNFKVTSEQLKEVFSCAGNVVKAEILTDKDGKSRGKGVVLFDHPHGAVEAIAMLHDQVFIDRRIVVHMDKKASDKPSLPSGLKSIGRGLGLSTSGNRFSSITDMGTGGSLGSVMMNTGMDSMGMGMSNYSSNQSSMGGGLGGMGMNNMGMGNMSGMGIGSSGGTGMGMTSTGMAMGMNSSGMASSASGMGGMGSSLNWGMNDMGSGVGLGGMNSMGSGMGSSVGGLSSMMSSGMEALRSSRRDSGRDSGRGSGGGDRDDYKIIVKNLPYHVSWQDLKDHFRKIGDVKLAKISKEDGKSTGQGYVTFRTLREAEDAVTRYNNTDFMGRNMRLKMDTGR